VAIEGAEFKGNLAARAAASDNTASDNTTILLHLSATERGETAWTCDRYPAAVLDREKIARLDADTARDRRGDLASQRVPDSEAALSFED